MKVTEHSPFYTQRSVSSLTNGWYLYGTTIVLVVQPCVIQIHQDDSFTILNTHHSSIFLPITVEEMLIRRK